MRNGLSLSRLHDAAFDSGLIGFDDDLRMLISPRLKRELRSARLPKSFGAYAGERLRFPDDAVLPEMAFLEEHRLKKLRKS